MMSYYIRFLYVITELAEYVLNSVYLGKHVKGSVSGTEPFAMYHRQSLDDLLPEGASEDGQVRENIACFKFWVFDQTPRLLFYFFAARFWGATIRGRRLFLRQFSDER